METTRTLTGRAPWAPKKLREELRNFDLKKFDKAPRESHQSPNLKEIMANRYWLCFDVGLTSSFERLYSWLDDHHAVECGDNIATFVHDKTFDPVAAELATIVQQDNGRGTRLYLIGKTIARDDPKKTGMGGRFIVGKRKASPWQGFGTASPADGSDEG